MTAIFSPDGSQVLTASLDHTAKLWDVSGGGEIATLTGHSLALSCYLQALKGLPSHLAVIGSIDNQSMSIHSLPQDQSVGYISSWLGCELRDLTDHEVGTSKIQCRCLESAGMDGKKSSEERGAIVIKALRDFE